MSSNEKVFRGHLEECVRHLNNLLLVVAPKCSKKAMVVKQPLADFCGVNTKTVSRWFNQGDLPNGSELIKLMCYLDLFGYKVIEWERMATARRNFAELVGFGLISIEEANSVLGYASTTSTYQALTGRINPSSDKDVTMWNTWKSKREELELAKEKARRVYCLDLGSTHKTQEKTEQTVQKQTDQPTKWTASIFLMEGLIALLKEDKFQFLISDDSQEFKIFMEAMIRLLAILDSISRRERNSENRVQSCGRKNNSKRQTRTVCCGSF